MQQKSKHPIRNAIMTRWGVGATLGAIVFWGVCYLIFGYVPVTSISLEGASITLSRWTDVFLGLWIALGILITMWAIEKGCLPYIYSALLFTIVGVTWIIWGLPVALIALVVCLWIGILIGTISLVTWTWEKWKIGEAVQNVLDRIGNYMTAQDVQNKLDAEKALLKKKVKRKKTKK